MGKGISTRKHTIVVLFVKISARSRRKKKPREFRCILISGYVGQTQQYLLEL